MFDTGMNCAGWDRLEREYLSPPKEDEVECDNEQCEDGKVPNPDYYPGDYAKGIPADEDEPETIDCERCEGHGVLSKKQLRREHEEARADYLYDQERDRRAEEER